MWFAFDLHLSGARNAQRAQTGWFRRLLLLTVSTAARWRAKKRLGRTIHARCYTRSEKFECGQPMIYRLRSRVNSSSHDGVASALLAKRVWTVCRERIHNAWANGKNPLGRIAKRWSPERRLCGIFAAPRPTSPSYRHGGPIALA